MRDRRRQRSLVQRCRTRQRCAAVSPRQGLRRGLLREEGAAGDGQCAREGPKLASRRQAWVSRGRVVARRSGATRVTRSGLSGLERSAGSTQRSPSGEAACSAVGRCRGCSCRTSVAEVGEKHLPRFTEVSREGGRGGAAVARDGGASGRDGSNVAGERVRRALRRGPSPGNTRALTRSQDRGSSQRKALRSRARLHP